MKWFSTLICAMVVSAFLTGCLSPSGDTVRQKQINAKLMADDALEMVYSRYPKARKMVQDAAGYGVYKNTGGQWILISTESGWGIIHNNITGEDKYMKLLSLGFGLGIGFRDFRAVLLFDDQESIDYFINMGWTGNFQTNAAFRFGSTGGSAAAATEVTPGIRLYKVTVNGVVLQATFQGTKTWVNEELTPKTPEKKPAPKKGQTNKAKPQK